MNIEELFDGLTRAGPGDSASLLWALDLAGVAGDAVVLDAGCGVGADLAGLRARLPLARIVAVDQLAHFTARVQREHPTVSVHQADMTDPPGGPFDLIWSAGAVYGPGVTACLTAWRGHLHKGGAVAFSHLCWRVADPSPAAQAFWQAEGAQLDSAAALEAEVQACGYGVLGALWLQPAAWAAYYDPLEQRLDDLPQDDELVALFRAEIALWRAHGDDYGYRLIVARPA
jgi:cyclopropane fatty-acyl-phospholipid synthase-like methyltransferase